MSYVAVGQLVDLASSIIEYFLNECMAEIVRAAILPLYIYEPLMILLALAFLASAITSIIILRIFLRVIIKDLYNGGLSFSLQGHKYQLLV